MRVTKYPQSCMAVEVDGHRLLLDPGTLVAPRYAVEDLGDIDAVLLTHRHADHLDPDLVVALHERDVPLFGNDDVLAALADRVPAGAITVVGDGDRFEAAGIEVTAHDLPHVVMVDGSEGPPNTGFLIDATLFHPGDGIELTGVRAPAVAAPIAGPSISFHDAYRLVRSLGADTVVPVHYEVFVADPDHFARVCDIAEVRVLEEGASTDL